MSDKCNSWTDSMWCNSNKSFCDPRITCGFDNTRYQTILRYGDVVTLQLNEGGTRIYPGTKVGWLSDTTNLVSSDPIEFTVVCPDDFSVRRELNRTDDFLLIEKGGKRMLSVSKNGDEVALMRATPQRLHDPFSRISSFDIMNIKGGITSRIEPFYGNNFLYFNRNGVALVWVWLNNRIVLRDYHYFQTTTPITNMNKCKLNNVTQIIFH